MGHNFHICLRSGTMGLTPPPPSFFFTTRMSTGVRQLGLGEHIERFCNHILMRKKKVGKVAKEGKRAKGTKVADRK